MIKAINGHYESIHQYNFFYFFISNMKHHLYFSLIIKLEQMHNNIITAVLKNNIFRKRGSKSPDRYQNALIE